MRIAVVTCYHDPDYVRARTLRAALKQLPDVKPIIIKNTHKGIWRYPEVLWKLWQVKKRQKPDAYLLTFRGQEILPFVLFIAGKKPVIFDELIVPIAYANNEQHAPSLKKRVYYFLARRSESLYRRWLRRCTYILADTATHAELSARTSEVNLSKYLVVPVGCDEKLIRPHSATAADAETFQVYFSSTVMQPLIGVPVVLEAARQLSNKPNITFHIVGGNRAIRAAVADAVKDGANIRFDSWLHLEALVAAMDASSLALGGPFGDTAQGQHVVTTKTYQALGAGMPVVVGNSPASQEYFHDKDNALVVRQGDAAKLAKAIAWASNNPKELGKIGINGRKLYEKEFSTSAITEKLRPIADALIL
jgi:glycosyltransferase involved in cell wall biosynthesis